MIRGAERAASDLSFTMLVVETEESGDAERTALDRLIPVVDGVILSSSPMSDSAIRSIAVKAAGWLGRRYPSYPSDVVDRRLGLARMTIGEAGSHSSGRPSALADRPRPECPFMISPCRHRSRKGLVIIGRLESQEPHRKDFETVASERRNRRHGR
jgi:hypothetical protein